MTNYPKEIYCLTENGTENTDVEDRWLCRKAYDLGKAHANRLEGWSNLTQAIKGGENIDWEKLDQRPAKCVHPDLGTLMYKLERYEDSDGSVFDPEDPDSWDVREDDAWRRTLIESWLGNNHWSLWVEGDIPLKPKTADQLPLGTCLEGKPDGGTSPCRGVVVERDDKKIVVLADALGIFPAEEITVTKEYSIGTFTTEEEK